MSALYYAAALPGAGTITGPVLQLKEGPCESMGFQVSMTYGSGGTSVAVYCQTSFDAGATWCDVAAFALATANARTIMNVSALTTLLTPATPTDGSLATGTALAGIFSSHWRAKLVIVGTYAATSLRVDAQPNRGRLTSLT